MTKTENRLERAAQIAERSGLRRFQTGACIYQHDDPISVGWSHFSDLRLQRYRSIHAELHAVLRAQRGVLRDATIYVAMIRGKSGNVGLAKPCLICQELLWAVGITSVYFTVEAKQYSHVDLLAPNTPA